MVNPDFMVKWKTGPPSMSLAIRMTMVLERVKKARKIDIPQKEVTKQLKTLGKEHQDWKSGTAWFRITNQILLNLCPLMLPGIHISE